MSDSFVMQASPKELSGLSESLYVHLLSVRCDDPAGIRAAPSLPGAPGRYS
jgi:hypothetical protein